MLSAGTNNVTMVFMFNVDSLCRLVRHLRGNGKDRLFSGSDSFFGALESNYGIFAGIVINWLVDVNLSASVIFDSID